MNALVHRKWVDRDDQSDRKRVKARWKSVVDELVMGNPHWMVCWCIETKKGDLERPLECLEVYMLWREGRRPHIWCLDRSETETGIWWRCRVGGGDLSCRQPNRLSLVGDICCWCPGICWSPIGGGDLCPEQGLRYTPFSFNYTQSMATNK